jgi:hypothetical protein
MWIDEETALKLPTETAKRRNGTGYAVALEMFHQLHCLVRKAPVLLQSHSRAVEYLQLFLDRIEYAFFSTTLTETISTRLQRYSRNTRVCSMVISLMLSESYKNCEHGISGLNR